MTKNEWSCFHCFIIRGKYPGKWCQPECPILHDGKVMSKEEINNASREVQKYFTHSTIDNLKSVIDCKGDIFYKKNDQLKGQN